MQGSGEPSPSTEHKKSEETTTKQQQSTTESSSSIFGSFASSEGSVLFGGSPAPAPAVAPFASSLFSTPHAKNPLSSLLHQHHTDNDNRPGAAATAASSSRETTASKQQPQAQSQQSNNQTASSQYLKQQQEPFVTKKEAEPKPQPQVSITAITDSENGGGGSNDWDNDWDFDDDQAVVVVKDHHQQQQQQQPSSSSLLLGANEDVVMKSMPPALCDIDAQHPSDTKHEMLTFSRGEEQQPQPPRQEAQQEQGSLGGTAIHIQNVLRDNSALPLEQGAIETLEAITTRQDMSQDEATNEWKGEDLDDIYDDDDDDEDEDDGSENDVPNVGDGHGNASEDSEPIVDDLPVVDPFRIDEAARITVESTIPDLPDGTSDFVQDQVDTSGPDDVPVSLQEPIDNPAVPPVTPVNVIDHFEAAPVNAVEHAVQDDLIDCLPVIDPEPIDSLEDEIAGMLDERSHDDGEPPADVLPLDQMVSTGTRFDESRNVDSVGFSQLVPEELPLMAATLHHAPFESVLPEDEPMKPEMSTASQPSIGPAIDSNATSPTQALEQPPKTNGVEIAVDAVVTTFALDANGSIKTQASEPETIGEDPGVDTVTSSSEPLEHMISDSILDQFTHQMQRLEEHHSLEIQELQKGHERALQNALNSVSHADCDAQRAALETDFLGRLREKDEQLQEIMLVNEGMELKMEVLKREVAGTRKLLEEREKAMESSIAAHNQEKKLLTEKLKKMQANAGSVDADVHQLQAKLKAAQEELEESNEAYAGLKARVKAVATELKERRGECRNLASTNVELSDANERITAKLAGLQAQLDDRDRSEVEKGEERDDLRGKVKALEDELQEAEKKLLERDAVGEKALAAYKKKAQNSLAVANARAAAALQAKEEAELEARAARSTADNAAERARKAEAKGSEALEEARLYVKEMEEQVVILERSANVANNSLSEIQRRVTDAKAEEESARAALDKSAKELVSVSRDLQLEKNKTSELQQECDDLQRRSNDLYDEVETLREELRKTATAAFMAHNNKNNKNDGTGSDASGGMDLKSRLAGANFVADKSESESTILMLQRELRDANQAIKELKETLRSTIESESSEQQQNDGRRVRADDSSNLIRGGNTNNANNTNTNNDSTPLFYAMEKQAELNQAREEINRLANLLGELQSEKMQAYEAVENMKRDKAAAEARLARYEKLGTIMGTGGGGASQRRGGGSTRMPPKSVAYGGGGRGYGSAAVARKHAAHLVDSSDAMSIGSVESNDSMDDVGGPTLESSQVNLEYLKNVMLSYLNAKTLNERKRLVPAVSAVLCLTPDETAAAMKSVLESGSVESVGLSFFEGLKLM